ncbi:unnamed protein product [Adineta ricciae]|uniref:Uncharacterized protein n=1 Tax=Adineta ricciae TaxID=249248 RepID=A0A815XZY8_ADIRI|nr:unnamed protein product [Adineta ricciae]
MGKRKTRLSLFSTIVQKINENERKLPSSDCHLIDNEYFTAFNSLDDIQEFHAKVAEQQQKSSLDEETDVQNEHEDQDMDMKSFAQQFLIDSPETEDLSLIRTSSQEIFTTDQPINWSPKTNVDKNFSQSSDNKRRKSTMPVKLPVQSMHKRQRRHIRDLPQSSDFIFTPDHNRRALLNTSSSIFDYSQTESISSNHHESTRSSDSSLIKNEPIESEQVLIEPKEEPVDVQMTSIGAMSFGTSQFSGDLDNYVQNIHLIRQSSNPVDSNPLVSSRPKRIRKRKKLYIEESELPTKPNKIKTPIRKKRPLPQVPSAFQLTDAEIEQQFGERLSVVKSEHDGDIQQRINSQVVIEFEPVSSTPQTPMEKARAKLTSALERGHDPDTYLLKIRSREHKIIEVQLAIYGTADWYSLRTKILTKIEEALRGLRVSWTKIDIVVDDFDVQISTSSQTASITPPSSISNMNSSWFLKALSESGPLIVHIHDRRYPQRRLLIKCSCAECSVNSIDDSFRSSLPVIVNASPATTPTRRLTTPSILNKTSQSNISSSHNIATTFFNELIYLYGRNTVVSVTQCVLDLALIVSVHASLPSLCVSPNYSTEEYKKKYQQIIDPLKCTLNDNEKILLNKTSMIARVVSVNAINNTQSIVFSKPPDILAFYDSIRQNNAKIRSAKSMRKLISTSFTSPISPPSQSNLLKTRAVILPKPSTPLSLGHTSSAMNVIELRKVNEPNLQVQRLSSQINHSDTNEPKQRTICTPIIELKPITSGSSVITQNIHSLTRDSLTHEVNKETTTERNELTSLPNETTSSANTNTRIIRLSIAKSTSSDAQRPSTISPPTFRLVTSPKSNSESTSSHSISSANAAETVPLVPKQINIIKPLSSTPTCLTPAVKLSNPVLIANRSQPPTTK